MIISEKDTTREERFYIRHLCDKVIESHGKNNSIGQYDRFIRRMINSWAGTGHDEKYLISVIDQAFMKTKPER